MSASPKHPAPRRDAPRRSPRPKARGGAGTLVGSVLGFLIAGAGAGGAALWAGGCSGDEPPGPTSEPTSRVSQLEAPSAVPTASAAPSATAAAVASAAPTAVPDDKPYTGPLLGAMALQTPVYPSPDFSKDRIGYIRHGSKVPVEANQVKGSSSCAKGWFKLVDGGFVCGKYATLDVNAPQVRLGITAPNLDDVLPYRYAYNTAHGTPLYKSVPSKEDMMRYEPYLAEAKEKKRKKRDEDGAGGGGAVPSSDSNAAPPAQAASAAAPDTAVPAAGEGDQSASAVAAAAALGLGDAGVETPPEPPKPWWQQKQEKGKSLEVKLSDLESDADGTVAKRMVKGFFVAVDKTFGWNNRLWYKTTAGLVAPTDRMYIAKGPSSQGMEVPDGVTQIGFITAAKSAKYEIDTEKKEVKTVGSVPRFSAFGLTGATTSVKTIVYRQTTEGWWMKAIDGTYTDPGPRPSDLAAGEKWVDVNLTRKTLLAFNGDKPFYAALVSPGKKSKKKDKDHSTPTGMYRIREKHITVTMDGDGAVAGDLPYSIEDVPFVAYYDRSYALHGAFWHSNFGREMSHGCVNLSPLDAKKIFFWTEPQLPRGWHAVWSSDKNRGTLVVIHE